MIGYFGGYELKGEKGMFKDIIMCIIVCGIIFISAFVAIGIAFIGNLFGSVTCFIAGAIGCIVSLELACIGIDKAMKWFKN